MTIEIQVPLLIGGILVALGWLMGRMSLTKACMMFKTGGWKGVCFNCNKEMEYALMSRILGRTYFQSICPNCKGVHKFHT